MAQNALLLLRAAAADAGLKLTARGNLTRRVVAEMCDVFAWPGVDKADAFQLQKVVNEPDFLPLFFVRNVVEAAKLPRPRKGYLKSTPAGRKMLDEARIGALQAVLFHVASGTSTWDLDEACITHGHNTTPASCSGRCRLPRTIGNRVNA